jgi:hypothetical protein
MVQISLWIPSGKQLQGKENVKAYFTAHPELADEVDKLVREKLVK